VEHKLAILLIEHRRTDNISRQNVARELDAVVRKVEYLSKRMSQGGFPHTRHILNKQVTFRQQARNCQLYLPLFPKHYLADKIDSFLYDTTYY
jgi:hypothetical protein